MKVFPVAMVTFPMKPIMEPIPFVIMKEPLCFRARTKPAMAEVQKFSPVKATWM